jgi:hypothetical protein
LEGFSSTIELHPRGPRLQRFSLRFLCVSVHTSLLAQTHTDALAERTRSERCQHPEKNKGIGGEGWIRTSVSEESDLQSDAINHSATSPFGRASNYGGKRGFRQTHVTTQRQVWLSSRTIAIFYKLFVRTPILLGLDLINFFID